MAACAHPYPASLRVGVLILLLGALFPQTGVVDPRHLADRERKRLPLPMMSKGSEDLVWSRLGAQIRQPRRRHLMARGLTDLGVPDRQPGRDAQLFA